MTTDDRSLEFEIEVRGTPEEVWSAIATGPGISSWYVPHTIEERTNGEATASFGEAPEMQVVGRVAAWDPPRRILIDGGEGVPGLAFEWLVEAKSGSTCIVRLVNTGFGAGEEWDAHYDGMAGGWQLFLENLRLHLQHFAGRAANASLPMASWTGPRAVAWDRLCTSLGLPVAAAVGDRVSVTAAGTPGLVGVVTRSTPWSVSLLLEQPAAGTAFIAVEGAGETVEVSIWSYLYGDAGAMAVERDQPQWQAWLGERSA